MNRRALLIVSSSAFTLAAVAAVLSYWESSSVSDDRQAHGYAGSASCVECHAYIHEAWTQSVHAKAERAIDPLLDHSAFVPPREVVHDKKHAIVSEKDGSFQMSLLSSEDRMQTFQPIRVLGETPLRQFLIPTRRGHVQVTSLAFDPTKQEWFDVFEGENRRPDEWGYWANRGMNWNSMCAACHNTALKKNYDPESDSYSTEWEELGVGCEACHGPAQEHVEWQQEYGDEGEDPTVSKLEPKQQVDTCGTCHARRLDLTESFLPGDLFLDHYLPEIPSATDVYYPDGQVREENYEYISFRLSRMYHEKVICADCHDPHTARVKMEGNDLCMQCHQGKIDPAAHSHHRLDEAGGECASCHMPVTVYMQRQPRHDHGFTIPDPELTLLAGVPNACNRCHTQESAQWALDAMQRWYGASPSTRYSAQRARLVARAREANSSVLGELSKVALEDPFPAWRAVAASLLEPWLHLPEIRETVTRLLQDPDPLVRVTTVGMLDSAALEMRERVAPLLEDPVRAVRTRAAWVLRTSIPSDHLALSELRTQLRLNCDQPLGALLMGEFLQARGQAEDALATWRRALEWDRHAEPLWASLAIGLSQMERPDEAVALLQEARKELPESPRLHYLLGLGYAELGNFRGAAEALQRACELEPGHARAWYNLGLALHEQQRVPEAVEALERAASLESANPDYPYVLATVYMDMGQTRQAERAARAALRANPAHPGARQLLEHLSRGNPVGRPN